MVVVVVVAMVVVLPGVVETGSGVTVGPGIGSYGEDEVPIVERCYYL